MLRSLSIRDVVLIDRLDLTFQPGLSVLTGETGAGKSILLDALGLALGARGDSSLVRHGAERASVSAAFTLAPGHPLRRLFAEHGFDEVAETGALILRRVLGADGRGRAFLDDQPVSVAFLREVGGHLVEIQAQLESHGLLDASTHRGLLDAFAGLDDEVRGVGAGWRDWREAARARANAQSEIEAARSDENYLRHVVDELLALAPCSGEEEELAARRALMMTSEKLIGAMNAAAAELSYGYGVEASLRAALRHLERSADKAPGGTEELLRPLIEALERAAGETAGAVAGLEVAASRLDLDPRRLEETEERLFALRAAARKHGCPVDELSGLRERLVAQLAAIEDETDWLARLERAEGEARADYVEAASGLSKVRRWAAKALDQAVAGELPPLRLEKTAFRTRVTELDETGWGERGIDRVCFEVAANPGTPLGPLARVASGGELVRLMLALKVVLKAAAPIPTLIFDEVDAGIGGAAAAAVGERLVRLAEEVQVLVVTHSPQVAARGAHHWRIFKRGSEGEVRTGADELAADRRCEEIARMLAGKQVTDEARAAAGRLLAGDAGLGL